MTKEYEMEYTREDELLERISELEKENAELKEVHESDKRSLALIAEKGAELEKELKAEKEFNATLRKEIDEYTNSHTLCAKYKELEKEISILLSCKNCPENKGGYICQKEYEDKCLSQKIQYIKELQEENKKWKDEWQEQVQKANDEGYARTLQTIQLNKAKEIIEELISQNRKLWVYSDIREQAEQFLKESE